MTPRRRSAGRPTMSRFDPFMSRPERPIPPPLGRLRASRSHGMSEHGQRRTPAGRLCRAAASRERRSVGSQGTDQSKTVRADPRGLADLDARAQVAVLAPVHGGGLLARDRLQPRLPSAGVRAARPGWRDGRVRRVGQSRHPVERRRGTADPGQGTRRGSVREPRRHPGRDANCADARQVRDPLQRSRRRAQRPGTAPTGAGRVLVLARR